MNTEQRLQGLEEEVKLLKNEIRSVLLDIKESLASGDWLVYSAPVVEGGMVKEVVGEQGVVGGAGGEGAAGVVEEGVSRSALEEKVVEGSDGEEPGGGEATGGHHSPGEVEGRLKVGGRKRDERGVLEPMRLVLLLEWLERSERELGVEETERMVEVYAEVGGLEEVERKALKLLVGVMGKGSKVRGSILNRLMELDGLMRRRDAGEVLQETVLKLLSRNERKTE